MIPKPPPNKDLYKFLLFFPDFSLTTENFEIPICHVDEINVVNHKVAGRMRWSDMTINIVVDDLSKIYNKLSDLFSNCEKFKIKVEKVNKHRIVADSWIINGCFIKEINIVNMEENNVFDLFKIKTTISVDIVEKN